LQGLFGQILQGDEVVRERAIKFLIEKLKMLPEDMLTKEVEAYVVDESKKVSIHCIYCAMLLKQCSI
jgi:hypothetical protein